MAVTTPMDSIELPDLALTLRPSARYSYQGAVPDAVLIMIGQSWAKGAGGGPSQGCDKGARIDPGLAQGG